MILLLLILPITLNYNITLVFMLNNISLQIVTGIFLVMFYTKYSCQENVFFMLFPFFSLKKNEVNTYNAYSFMFIFFIAFCSIFNSLVPFFISIVIAIFFFLQPLSFFLKNEKFSLFFYDLIIILNKNEINLYLYQFYYYFIEHKNYKAHTIILNLFIVLYVFTSRYYFLNKHLPLPFYFILLLGFACLYIRFLVNIYVYINDCFLFFEELPPTTSSKSFININYKSNNTYHPVPQEKFSFFKKIGLTAAILTCGAACGTFYYTYIQANAAVEQANAALEQNVQIQQQNDLEALSQNLITKEQFCEFQPRYCARTSAADLFARMEAAKKAGMPVKSTN